MAKSNKIQYRKKDELELNRIVKNFNSKLGRIKKKVEDTSYLPDKISKDILKGKIETRKDFNRVVKSYKRFLMIGSEKKVVTENGIETTKWRKKEYSIAKGIATRKLKKRMEVIGISEYKGNLHLAKDLNLNVEFKDIKEIKPEDFESAFRRIEKRLSENYNQEQMERYKNNYIIALIRNLYEYGYLVAEKVRPIPAEEFAIMYFNNPILHIDFIYDPKEAEEKAYAIIDALEGLGH